MKKINLAVTGCLGRMGGQIIKSASLDKNFKLVTFTETKRTNRRIKGIKIEQNTDQAFKKASVIIDFTVPKCTFEVLKIASKLKKKEEKGTNGISKKRRGFDKKFFQRNTNFESRKYEFWYQPINVSNRNCIWISRQKIFK